MSTDDDKYPEQSGRRRFVKGVVGSAALAGVGTGTSAIVNTTTNPTGRGGGSLQYYGMANTAGPAPRAMPQIPVEIDADGFLKGIWPPVEEVSQGGRTINIARMELGGVEYSNEWFQYCGVQTYPGVVPEADQDNFFRYADSPPYEWQSADVSAGDKVHVDDFADYDSWGNNIGQAGIGKPAFATWRSQDVPQGSTMPVQIIRSTMVADAIQAAEGELADWLEASTQSDFIAILDKCTHFCCVPGFKSFTDSAKFDAADDIYCQCHQSVYDPYQIVKKQFVALPRPGD